MGSVGINSTRAGGVGPGSEAGRNPGPVGAALSAALAGRWVLQEFRSGAAVSPALACAVLLLLSCVGFVPYFL